MEKYFDRLIKTQLFFDIPKTALPSMLDHLNYYTKGYNKKEIILQEGEHIKYLGILLEGSIKIIKTDYNGNENIIAEIHKGDIFAEVFVCAEVYKSPVSIISSSESLILYLDYKKITNTGNSCAFSLKLISNMLKILANKSLYLNRRLEIISKRSLREKILTYLYYESGGMRKFCIPLNRESLANFLSADRSALSYELSKMKKEGILDYHKNKFELFL